MRSTIASILTVIVTPMIGLGVAQAESRFSQGMSHSFEPTHSTFEHSDFNTRQDDFKPNDMSASSSFRSNSLNSSQNNSDFKPNSDQFRASNTSFESVAGNSNPVVVQQNPRFSNMRMEFTDPDLTQLNFNVIGR